MATRYSFRWWKSHGWWRVDRSNPLPNQEGWDEIHGFRSPGEFRQFERWIKEALQDGSLSEIPVEERYSGGTAFTERWFRASSGQRCRLVSPEPPFQGVFIMVHGSVQPL